jgi:hypothetical protein
MFEALEKCILNRYQYLLDEYQPENDSREIAFMFRNHCIGCISMFREIYPDADFMTLRPFFSNLQKPTPLLSLNEANHWVFMLEAKLEYELRKKHCV